MLKLKELREPLNTTTNRIIVLVLAGGFVFALIVAVGQFIHDQQLVCSPWSYISDQFDQSNLPMVTPGTMPTVGDVGLCTLHPTGTQTFWHLMISLPGLLFMVGSAALLAWFLWGAAQPGPHSRVSPGRLRALGWFLTIGGPASALFGHWAEYQLTNTMMRVPLESGVWSQQWQHDFPWWYVFSGLVALLLSRMLRIDVRMSEDLEGTV